MKNPCTMKSVQSNLLREYGYDAASKTLAVSFTRSDKTALYPGVEPELFAQMEAAESKGKFFGAHIKTRKDFSYADAPEKAEAQG